MGNSNLSEPMFKFTTKLHVYKHRVKKNGLSALYLQVYISSPGVTDRNYFPLNLEWPIDKIDFENSMVLARYRSDNDYNMVIMSERSKLNEIAKLYRLLNRFLTVKELKRDVFCQLP